MWPVDSTEVTLLYQKPQPLSLPGVSLARGPASCPRSSQVPLCGAWLCTPRKSLQTPALRNNSPDQKPLMYREHFRKKKKVFYVEKKLQLCILYQQLCVKNGNQRESNIFKTFFFFKKETLVDLWYYIEATPRWQLGDGGTLHPRPRPGHTPKGQVTPQLLPAAKACTGIHC